VGIVGEAAEGVRERKAKCRYERGQLHGVLKPSELPQQLHEAFDSCMRQIYSLSHEPWIREKRAVQFPKIDFTANGCFSQRRRRESGSRSPELECRVRLWRSYVLLRFTRVYSSAKDWSERDLE
jgi:hypothetical protein